MQILVDSIAVVSSVSSFIVSIFLLWKGNPKTREQRKRLGLTFTALALLAFVLLSVTSIKLKTNIETLEQSGPFGSSYDIYYPVPYSSPPFLQVLQDDLSYGPLVGPVITEQRADGFTVSVNSHSCAVCFSWKSIGVPKR
jgi:hypothetical protein